MIEEGESLEESERLLSSTTSIRFGMELQSAFGHIWVDILTSPDRDRIIRCAASGQDFSYDEWPRPTILHTDIYGAPMLKFVREQDEQRRQRTHKIYHWSTEFVSFWRMFKKDEISQGGIEDDVISLLADPEESAKLPANSANFVEQCFERYNRNVNQLLCYPGLKDGMYDFEINPGQVGWLRTYIPALNKMKAAITESDGIVIASCDDYQPLAKQIIEDWLWEEHNVRLYAIGPSIEDNLLSENPENIVVHEKDSALISFMDRCQERHGKNSVVLLSWGTIWAPFRYPDILEAWIDEVLESGRPFILNRSAELFSRLSPWIEEKLKVATEADIGFQTNWIAQRTVCRHPALGVFVSHCGYASASESTVPIIGWPSFFDQSIIAQINVDNDSGWQLYQVRGPDAAKQGQKCRALELQGQQILGTLDAVREEARRVLLESHSQNPIYQRKMSNLRRIRRAMHASMSKGGCAFEDVERLLDLS
ncbi:hypothetical protein L7F22_003074 [Adiantum nelumboides]|nr:hypothetical protein [Adiantum nelumboides]